MQVGVSVTQYVYRVGILEKQLSTSRKNFDEDNRIRTMLRGVPTKLSMARYLIRELSKTNHQAISMIMEKEAELLAVKPQLAPKPKMEKTFIYGHSSMKWS